MLDRMFDLAGIGIGPFNLSLAALLEKTPHLKSRFFERKPRFEWHSEVMFTDSAMQTSYLKDLVTPVDPTNSYSFLNFLVQNHLLYPFLNTQRTSVSRQEFEQYCAWVSERLAPRLQFGTDVNEIQFDGHVFQIQTSQGTQTARNLCIATGLTPRLPDFAAHLQGPRFFHAKSAHIRNLNTEGLRVAVVGGGQTGVEVFRNALMGKWGRPRSLQLITPRKSLEPLDESAFTNEYFTPHYVDRFWDLSLERKTEIVAAQKLASDGNTPSYLLQLYQDLYRLKYVEKDPRPVHIFACRRMTAAARQETGYQLELSNTFLGRQENVEADLVILCTGFQTAVPAALAPLRSRIHLDALGRFQFHKSHAIHWDGPAQNRIYAMNFSRHNHGIIDPQTSLMAWRSAMVINDLTGENIYETEQKLPNFVEYGSPA